MKPLTGILLAAGALSVAIAATIYEATRSSPAATVAGGASPTISFLGGHNYTVTVTMSGPLTGSSTQGSVQTAMGSNFTVGPDITATPTTIQFTADVTNTTSVSQTTIARAVAAPSGSLVNAVDNGPSPPTTIGTNPGVKNTNLAPQTRNITQADDNSTIQADVGDTIVVTLPQTNMKPWTVTTNASLALQSSTTQGTSTVATFNATTAGTDNIVGSDPNGNKFSVIVVVS